MRAILSVLPAHIREQARNEAFQIYTADALKVLGENTARFAGGSYMKRFIDLIMPAPKETRTGDEIVEHMKQKLAALGGE